MIWKPYLFSAYLWAILVVSHKNGSGIYKYWGTVGLLGSMESLKCVLSAEKVFELGEWVICAGKEISLKKSVLILIHYCCSLVNTKMLLATSKSYPRDLKFESVGYFFIRNGNFSRKIELFNFWHISTMVWATLLILPHLKYEQNSIVLLNLVKSVISVLHFWQL